MVAICQCVPTGFRLVSYFCLCCLMFFAMFFASNLPKDRDSEVAVSCPTFGCACWSWLTPRAARAWTFWIISAQQAITQCNNDSLALYTYRYMSCKICREDYSNIFKLYSNTIGILSLHHFLQFLSQAAPGVSQCGGTLRATLRWISGRESSAWAPKVGDHGDLMHPTCWVCLKMGIPVKWHLFWGTWWFSNWFVGALFSDNPSFGQLQHGRYSQQEHPNCHQPTLATTITSITYRIIYIV